ncbi:MAG: hypothetical protein HY015_02230 [Bacteroidetes bacterium]|nr:hypothetical protein [Bacteroidota bacterium]MBI3481790.1 hypothetical protein [Bacteroidota bacterium]
MKKLLILTLFLVAAFAINTKAQTVYASSKGEKYHTADCKLSGDASGMELADAKKTKRTACAMCKPDEHLKDKKAQCTGTTADGTQCKRMTSNKNGKCFQHQSK